jgi:putative transposase
MAAHGIVLTYEAVQYRRRKFGWAYAKRLRRRRPRHGDDWPLDEAFLTTWREITGSALVV